MEDYPKSAYSKRVTEMVHELTALLEAETAKDGTHRGFVILSSEEVDATHHANIIGICGRGKEIADVLADFASQPNTSKIFRHVAMHNALQSILNK